MDWLKNFVNQNPKFSVAVPTILSAMNLGGKLLLAMSDGIITEDEVKGLTSALNGLEVSLLMLILFLIKKRDPKD